ncbi:MAG TPA: NnrS family protein [Arenimonas sp.]|uniref:NnrS family protein n=1 Tax=Arenimonas sp. TaxID=1872635 RepID=UPI002C22053D|nr:NnrS family protein [Arenimonas sp.]HMB55937.1 NnrS family protein [Arenimonas sp.]
MDSPLRVDSTTFSPRLLAAAPHRLLFFVGAGNVLLAMAWWTLWLVNARWPQFAMPQPAIPAGWMHALVMQYQVLPPFIFGFLMTVFPRWMSLPALVRWHYVPVGFGLLGGQLLTLVGLWGIPSCLYLGLLLTFTGWLVGLVILLSLLWQESKTTWHAISAAAALFFGLIGLGLVFAYLFTGNPRLMFAAIKFAAFGFLLPVYFTVNHRMIPFFASVALPDYRPFKPMPALALFWFLTLAHLGLELVHGYAWLWLCDLPMAALCLFLLVRWWPRSATMPALLRVLLLGFAWLPVAFAMYAGQSLWFAATDQYLFGRAPAHALFIGYFGSLLVAMVTRVTQGHSGRVLELGPTATFAFVLVQAVALLRIVAEVRVDALAWQAVAGIFWLVAFTPWVLRSLAIYLRPRADGKPD